MTPPGIQKRMIKAGILNYLMPLFMSMFLWSCGDNTQPKKHLVHHPEWQNYFDSCSVAGVTVLLDLKDSIWHVSDTIRMHEKSVVASTFKIFNSLVSLETGAVENESEIIAWDQVPRSREELNKDLDMREAFRISSLWYYQECARRVGDDRMKYWLEKADYGASDISRGIDSFWVKPGFTLSPVQQVDFLRRLKKDALPFSKRNMDITRNLMKQDSDHPGIEIFAKTGWYQDDVSNTGWFVGWIEGGTHQVVFATCVHHPEPSPDNFGECRKQITWNILRAMQFLPAS